MESKTVTWTPTKKRKFRRAYRHARARGLEQFTFDGNEFVTDYAKYLLEYLDAQFSGWDIRKVGEHNDKVR
jgi:hypothetical protein